MNRARAERWTCTQEDVRKVDSGLLSQLLKLRYLEPPAIGQLCAYGVLPLSEAERLLLERSSEAAVQAYRTRIADCADPQPDAWIGLALALHQLPPSPPLAALSAVSGADGRGARPSGHIRVPDLPADLASWFT